MTIPIEETAARATAFKALHIPGQPLLLANVYDALSARTVASLPACKALATASYALAQSIGKRDELLILEDQLSLVAPIAAVAAASNLPLTMDIQDGYASERDYDALTNVVQQFVTEFGAVGINLEDSWHDQDGGEETMMAEDEAVRRVQTAIKAAKDLGVEDFVVNARADTFLKGGKLEESIRRAKRYLEAGATVAFIFWPRTEKMEVEDVQRVIDELGGMANIGCRLGGPITTSDLARMGVARVSVGPQLYLAVAGAGEIAKGDEGVAAIVREKANQVFGL
ncbi:phosphoenolpyruvate phosphomutase-domain-containing protein [Cercophora newfieldiana]|uniref:Phosphoenolpyruvate phosphomutase-domain-containing protein n=1 Tax=Cercophora newfieldiana TaxID=92897 RepID=A0AA39YC43_9PEZI|nr:phosphoenolpyruvate phosphomutase-domain-containing protein [Cercophora newfieldiana]